jgi:NTE family protein
VTYDFRNLVFEGGGIRGIAYVGALKALEKKGVLPGIERVGGTSAGAINAVLLGLGYTWEEIEFRLNSFDFEKIRDATRGFFPNVYRLAKKFGWYKGDYCLRTIAEFIHDKTGVTETTFKNVEDMRKERGFKLPYFLGTDISAGVSDIFSAEHTPEMCVAEAVRISMSMPVFFASVRSDLGNVHVDGGVLDNYPIKLFDRWKYIDSKDYLVPDYYQRLNSQLEEQDLEASSYVFNKETLGFRLDTKEEISRFRDHEEPPQRKIKNVFQYSEALIRTVLDAQQSYHLHSDDWERTIYIDTLGVGTTDFHLDDEKKAGLIKSGYDCTMSYFDWYDSHKSRNLLNSKSSSATPVK